MLNSYFWSVGPGAFQLQFVSVFMRTSVCILVLCACMCVLCVYVCVNVYVCLSVHLRVYLSGFFIQHLLSILLIGMALQLHGKED